MSDGMRTRRLAGGRRHLGGLVPIFCALICPTPGDVQAGPPGGDPVRDRVVALVGRLGGEVRLDEQATGRPIVEIRLNTTRVADDQLGDLRGLSSLRTLDLTQTRISDAGLARLRGHEGLRSLLVYDTRVTDRGLEHIATMSGLEKLLVGSCDVSGPGLSHLASLKHLKALSLDRAGSHRFRAGGPGEPGPSRGARPGRVEDHRRGARARAGPLPAAAARARRQ